MARNTATTLIAIAMILFCALRTSAQQVVTFPAGGLHRLGVETLDQQLGGRFDLLAVTLQPKSGHGVLYLDGEPLQWGKWLTREQADRIMLFSSSHISTISFGVTTSNEMPVQKKLRIRCINRQD